MNAKVPSHLVPIGVPVKITPFAAQQRVNVFVLMEISTQLGSDDPFLVFAGERLCWSVPVLLTYPDRGAVGTVGEFLVDATTGELLLDQDTVERVTRETHRLAVEALASPAPTRYSDRHPPPTPPPRKGPTCESRDPDSSC